jgi:hypothetical protein
VTVDEDADALKIRVEAALRVTMRVAHIVPDGGRLAAGQTDFGHGSSLSLIGEQLR